MKDSWDELPEPRSWEDIFAGVPTSAGTEKQQARHKELREMERDMTEAEEQESNALFYTIYPQFAPKSRLTRWFERQVEQERGYILCKYLGYVNLEERTYWQKCEAIHQKRRQYPYNSVTVQYDMSDEQADQLWDEWEEVATAYEAAETAKPAWKRFLGL